VWKIGEVYIELLQGNMRERDNLEDLNVDGRKILKRIFKNRDGAWAGLIWLRIGTGGECL
jgi:hypothetical protein